MSPRPWLMVALCVAVPLGMLGLSSESWPAAGQRPERTPLPRSATGSTDGPDAKATGKKYALLVGINEYQHQNLPALRYAENDVAELARLLEKHKYQVVLLSNSAGKKDAASRPKKEIIEKRLKSILEKCERPDSVVVAFAGHGLQFEKESDAYFCPEDARPIVDKKESLVSLKGVYKGLEESFAGVKLLLVDACRNDPKLPRGARSGIDADNAP